MQRCWLSATRSVLPWVIPAALSVYIKYRMLSLGLHGGFTVVAVSLGRMSFEELGLWEKFSFFRADLLVTFLVVPVGLVILVRYLPSRCRTPFVVLFSAVISAVLYCQLRAFQEVGQFLSLDMFWTAVRWGLHDPSVISSYLDLRTSLALLGVAMVMAAVWRWGAKRRKRSPLNPVAARPWYIGSAVVGSCLVVLTIIAWTSPLPSTPFHESVLVGVLRSLANRSDVDTGEFRNLSVDELANRYREMTSTPAPDRDARYWGKAKGCNLLFFVLETAPARILPADGDLADFPNLRRLRETSFVGVSHYSTYPETDQAMFSIFSSWYPSSLAKNFSGQHPDLVVPGIIRKLAGLGYDTALYSPYDFKGELDSEMYRSLGFPRQVYPKIDERAFEATMRASYRRASIPWGWGGASMETRTALDTAALSLLNLDLERDLAEGRRFAFLFAPEVSHGPWPGLRRTSEEQDVVRAGRRVLEIPDQWLGEIMQRLERHHQLEQTVIVVVGDHGLRTRDEDPSFAGELFGDNSFHVPLVIYAPKAVDHVERIPWVTSHIDIAPTVLSLLGIERERKFEQGTPIWDPDLAKRTTYLFAQSYLGADGYHSNGRFFMWSHVTDTVYENTRMDFDPVNVVPRNSSAYLEASGSIRRMAGLEEVWATQFSQAKSVRNHFYNSASR